MVDKILGKLKASGRQGSSRQACPREETNQPITRWPMAPTGCTKPMLLPGTKFCATLYSGARHAGLLESTEGTLEKVLCEWLQRPWALVAQEQGAKKSAGNYFLLGDSTIVIDFSQSFPKMILSIMKRWWSDDEGNSMNVQTPPYARPSENLNPIKWVR